MRKGYRYRFESHSILFLSMMMIGLNMFIFTVLSIINFYLVGSLTHALVLTGVAALLFFGPFFMARRAHEEPKRMGETLKDDLFMMGFSHASILIGIYLMFYIGFPA